MTPSERIQTARRAAEWLKLIGASINLGDALHPTLVEDLAHLLGIEPTRQVCVYPDRAHTIVALDASLDGVRVTAQGSRAVSVQDRGAIVWWAREGREGTPEDLDAAIAAFAVDAPREVAP